MHLEKRTFHNELAPCGVYCGACPAFNKTCHGCASSDQNQSRSSKWGCKIRGCCYTEKKLIYCIDCKEFPCSKIRKKLTGSHPGDRRFRYRHEIPFVFENMTTMGQKKYLEYQKERWKCTSCDGTIRFYNYSCDKCGEKNQVVK